MYHADANFLVLAEKVKAERNAYLMFLPSINGALRLGDILVYARTVG